MYKEKLSAEQWGEIYNKSRTKLVINNVENDNVACWTKELERLTHKGDRVLEIGAGSGETSIYLAKMERDVTALDFSKQALELIENVSQGMVNTIYADATKDLPIEPESFDVIFQAGLLEHFNYEEQCKMLALWGKYLKEDGIMISLVPNASSLAYRIGKAISEKKGTWQYGIETPLSSFQMQMNEAGYRVIEEYTIGAEHALKFLPKFSLLRIILKHLLNNNICNDICGQGYLLVTIAKKGSR